MCTAYLDDNWSNLSPSLHFRGSFDILGSLEFVPQMLNNCIQVYTPSRVRRKVYEFSGLLSDTLKFELVLRGDIWESIFNNHIPSKEDIWLYLFASEKERSASALYISICKGARGFKVEVPPCKGTFLLEIDHNLSLYVGLRDTFLYWSLCVAKIWWWERL